MLEQVAILQAQTDARRRHVVHAVDFPGFSVAEELAVVRFDEMRRVRLKLMQLVGKPIDHVAAMVHQLGGDDEIVSGKIGYVKGVRAVVIVGRPGIDLFAGDGLANLKILVMRMRQLGDVPAEGDDVIGELGITLGATLQEKRPPLDRGRKFADEFLNSRLRVEA